MQRKSKSWLTIVLRARTEIASRTYRRSTPESFLARLATFHGMLITGGDNQGIVQHCHPLWPARRSD